MRNFDVIVLGLGGMGSAALYHMARRGLRVCGVEQFERAHARGSSHGQSRLIRRAYFEHPGYVPLVDESWRWWRELEDETGKSLLQRTGLVLSGPGEGAVIGGTRAAAVAHRFDVVDLSPADAAGRWPGLAFSPEADVLFEADAGCLRVEECIRAHISAAERRGAVALFEQSEVAWRAERLGVTVTVGREELTAERLIVCAGAWSSKVLGAESPPLRVLRKTVFWYPHCIAAMHVEAGCPVFGYDTPAGFVYGFPRLDARGVKVANHGGGGQIVDPDRLNRTVSSAEVGEVEDFRVRHLPGLAGPVGDTSVCMYTMSPDEHFIIDRHPRHGNVAVACGFSGHGFKFAPVVGAELAGWACGSSIRHGVFQPWPAGGRG